MTRMPEPDRGSPLRPGMAPLDRLALVLATAGGAGYTPKLPGTMGALVGVGVYLLLGSQPAPYWVLAGVLTAAGIWSAARVEAIQGHDSPRIVIDEVVGQMITLGFLTGGGGAGSGVLTILGFLLFRFFDILKPFPIRRLEQLPGGFGVMADDIGAGVYGFVTLAVLDALLTGLL